MARRKKPNGSDAAFEIALYVAEAAVGVFLKNEDFARGFFVGRGYSVVDSLEMARRGIAASSK